MISPAGDSPRIRREPSPAQNEPPRPPPLRSPAAGAGPAAAPPAGSSGGRPAAGRAPPGARFAALGRAGILVTGLASPVGSGAVTPTATAPRPAAPGRAACLCAAGSLRPARPRSYSGPWDDRSMNGTTGTAAGDVITDLGHDVYQIDTRMAGYSGIVAGYLILSDRPCLVETGTAPSAPLVIRALAHLGVGPADLATLAVTHIHLDHAGGTGDLAEHFPAP